MHFEDERNLLGHFTPNRCFLEKVPADFCCIRKRRPMYLQQRGVPSTNVNVQVSIVATWIVRGTMGYLGVSLTSENEQRRSKNSMSRKRNRPGFISRKMNREGYLGISLTSESELREKQQINESRT